jgi:hypothetical protein
MPTLVADQELDTHMSDWTSEQADAVRRFRNLVRELDPGLDERLAADGMFAGMLTFNREGMFIYAAGRRAGGRSSLHLMTYYGSAELQRRHGAAMKKVMAGKSCLAFHRWDELPIQAIEDCVRNGSVALLKALTGYEGSRKARAAATRKARKSSP